MMTQTFYWSRTFSPFRKPLHFQCRVSFSDHKSKNDSLFIANHTIAEFFRHFTSGRAYFIYDAQQAYQIIKEDILSNFSPVALGNNDYSLVVSMMDNLSLQGAVIYDALIARASHKAKADALMTYNIKDFKRVWPLTDADLIEP